MRIKEVIKEKGYTIEAVAQALGKSKSGMSQIVNNDNTPPQTLRSIANVIGCNVSEFFLDEDTYTTNNTNEGVILCPHCGKGIKIILDKA